MTTAVLAHSHPPGDDSGVISVDAALLFRRAFGDDPDVVASAPGRANLIGEHVDYVGGPVLPIALEMRTAVAVRLRDAGESRAASLQDSAQIRTFDPRLRERSGRWTDYIGAVTRALEVNGVPVVALDVAVASDVPVGSGLSSSAALSVAAAAAISTATGQPVQPLAVAGLALRAEREFVGVPCGMMDPWVSSLGREGHALHLECATGATLQVPFTEAVLLVHSGIERSLNDAPYAERVADCAAALTGLRQMVPGIAYLAQATEPQVRAAPMSASARQRALHVVGETVRVRDAVRQLEAGRPFPGALLNETHASLRDLFDCSTHDLDWLAEAAIGMDGVHGARLTGAGWGGCVLVLGDPGALAGVGERLARDYQRRTSRAPKMWISRAENGMTIDLTHVGNRH